MIPLPTTWPAKEVPAVRGIKEVLLVCAKLIIFLMSSSVFGMATAKGISLYAEASVAYSIRMVLSVKKSPSIESANSCNFSFIYQLFLCCKISLFLWNTDDTDLTDVCRFLSVFKLYNLCH